MSGAVRVVALGNAAAGDDGAALLALRRLDLDLFRDVELIEAGRPGPGLLDLLDPTIPTILLDVVRARAAPGDVVEVPLGQLAEVAIDDASVSSHGLGVAHAMRLARALGRPLPRGMLIGIEGQRFEPGAGLSGAVSLGMDGFVEAIGAAIAAMCETADGGG